MTLCSLLTIVAFLYYALFSCTIRYSGTWSLYWMSAFQTVFLKWISMHFFKDVWVVCIDSHGVNPPMMRVGYHQDGNKGLSLRSFKLLILFQLWFAVKVSTNVHYVIVTHVLFIFSLSSVQFSLPIMSDFFQPHGLQHARPPYSSPTLGVYANSHPLNRWCHLTISSSVIPFSSRLQSFPASGSFQTCQFFTSGGQSIGISASTSILPMNIQDWFSLGWIGWISLQSKGLSRIFSNTTALTGKGQIFSLALTKLYTLILSTVSVLEFWLITQSFLLTDAEIMAEYEEVHRIHEKFIEPCSKSIFRSWNDDR